MHEGTITVTLTENQDHALWYGMRQLVTMKPEMWRACQTAGTHTAKGMKYRLTFGQYAIMLKAAREFADDGHSPGDNQMLVDAERAMWKLQQAGEKQGWPFEDDVCQHPEKETYEKKWPDFKDGWTQSTGKLTLTTACKVCGEELDSKPNGTY